MKKYVPGLAVILVMYWWIRYRKPVKSTRRVSAKNSLNKLVNRFSKVPPVKQEVIVLQRQKNYVKNKNKGRWIANSMTLRSAKNKIK